MVFWLLYIKRLVEEAFMLPWIFIGRWQGRKNPLPHNYDLFCFYPSPSLGGAEKINAYVLEAFPDKKIMVVFTKKFQHESFISFYQRHNVTTTDISAEADNKKRYWKSFVERGRWARYINGQSKKPSVFIGQCNFGYKLSSHLHKAIHVAELIHVAEKKFAWITFPYIPFLDVRVTPGNSITKQHIRYYREIGVPKKYDSRWRAITYKLQSIPAQLHGRSFSLPLKVYYAGRGGYQKRLWLLMQIIRHCLHHQLPVAFHLAGPVENEIDEDLRTHITYHGQITNTHDMYALHKAMDVLLMTSAFEGFPLVIQEAMANGAVPLVTAVDVIPEHITHSENGLLISHPNSEAEVVQQAVEQLRLLCDNPSLLKVMSNNAYAYARHHFDAATFNAAYHNAIFPNE